ncbi:MAG: DUF5050 domain-containing protein [Clostridium sp.]|nr:DUF5050 domain-containing protein [Clostridium sp.]
MVKRLIKAKGVICISFIVMALALVSVHAAAAGMAEDWRVPARAARSGNYLFYSAGMDNRGTLVRYNLKTGKKKVLCNGGCRSISVKGKYVYFSLDAKKGDNSEITKYGVYRIRKNGGKRKKLANGRNPVIIGNKIYYLGVKGTGGQSVCGIYRMNLDGSKKECLLASDKLHNGDMLIAGENKLLFSEYEIVSEYGYRNNWKCLNLTDGSISSYEKGTGSVYANTDCAWYVRDLELLVGNIKVGNGKKGYAYKYAGKNLYRINEKKKKGKKKKIAVFSKGQIEYVADLDGYIFVMVYKSDKQYVNAMHVYVMKANGKQKRHLGKFVPAGGTWE